MTRTSPWDEIDAALLSVAKTGTTLAELTAQSDVPDQSKLPVAVVKDLVCGYVQAGWLVLPPFSLTYELTLAGHAKLAELDQATAPTRLAKAA